MEIAFSTHGLKNKTDFAKRIRSAIKRGLSAEDALRAATTTPSRLFGVSDTIGKLARGYQASFIIADGDLFSEKTKIVETWGIEQIIRDAFLAARQYRNRWIDWRRNREGMPPRRDLELDAMVEILEKERWIHFCRQSVLGRA